MDKDLLKAIRDRFEDARPDDRHSLIGEGWDQWKDIGELLDIVDGLLGEGVMTLQQFRFLYRVLTGQVEGEEHRQGPTSLTSRACRSYGWLVVEYRDISDPPLAEVTEKGKEQMRIAFPEFFDDTLDADKASTHGEQGC